MMQRVRSNNYSTELAAARAKLREYMKIELFIMSGVDFEKFSDIMLTKNNPFVEQTQLVLIDPPYEIRRHKGRNNAEYDNLFPDDMKKVV